MTLAWPVVVYYELDKPFIRAWSMCKPTGGSAWRVNPDTNFKHEIAMDWVTKPGLWEDWR